MDPVQPTIPQQPVSQVPVQPEGKKFNMWMIMAIAFSILLLGVGGYAVMNQSQTQKSATSISPTTITPTKNADLSEKRIYNNSKYNYSIQYPSILSFKETTGSGYGLVFNDVSFRNYPAEELFMKSDAISISIRVADTKEAITNLQQWLEKASIGPRVDGTTGPRVKDFSPTKVGSIDAFEYFEGQESIWKNVAFYKDKKLFIFTVHATGETGSIYTENPQAEQVFNQMLSTFKFTNQVQTFDTSTWKTYSNSKFGFSFNYPPEFKQDINSPHVLKNLKGIEIGSVVYGPNEDIENYKGATTKIDASIVSNMTLPTGSTAEAFVNTGDNGSITVIIYYKKNNQDMRIMLWCGGNNSECKSLLTQILPTFKFTN